MEAILYLLCGVAAGYGLSRWRIAQERRRAEERQRLATFYDQLEALFEPLPGEAEWKRRQRA